MKIKVFCLVIFVGIVSLFIIFLKNSPLFTYQESDSGISAQKESGDKPWEKVFFKFIDQRVKEVGYLDLKEKKIPSGSREIRVWVGFDLSPLRGIILEQNDSKWRAIQVPPEGKKESHLN